MALTKLFFYNKDRDKIIKIILKGSHYDLYAVEEETRKSDIDTMILRGNHKPSHSELNSDVLDKAISKEINHGYIANTLKGKLNSQQKTNVSWLVTTIKAILKTPIQKFKKRISRSV